MRRGILLAALLLIGGCRPKFGGAATGAASSDGAVQQFLFAARAQDLQAMSAVWGDEQGATRDRADRTEMERRLIIMACHLRHDESQVGAAQASEAGRTVHRVALTQGAKKASPNFTTVRNSKSGRWYVADFEMAALSGWCTGTQRPPTGAPR